MEEEPIVRTLHCHYCKKFISITTVPDFIGFCNISCAENWKKEIGSESERKFLKEVKDDKMNDYSANYRYET